jgi:hypothetical protein
MRKPLDMELTLLKTPTIKYAWLIGIIAAVLFVLFCWWCYHVRDRSGTNSSLPQGPPEHLFYFH